MKPTMQPQVYSGICDNCKKSYTTTDVYRTTMAYQWCDEKCKETLKVKETQKKIIVAIDRIIPLKFRPLETDRRAELSRYYNQSLFIAGEIGSGKTVFMCSMLKKYIKEQKRKCKFISFPKWIMRLQSMFRNNGGASPFEEAEDIASFQGILAIDDLGAEKLTEYVRQIIYFIINEREQQELLTLITSNFSLEEIDELIDPRISSRIAGMCEILDFRGSDRRLKQLQGKKP